LIRTGRYLHRSPAAFVKTLPDRYSGAHLRNIHFNRSRNSETAFCSPALTGCCHPTVTRSKLLTCFFCSRLAFPGPVRSPANCPLRVAPHAASAGFPLPGSHSAVRTASWLFTPLRGFLFPSRLTCPTRTRLDDSPARAARFPFAPRTGCF
jgi:hypothetical protein